MSDYKVEYHNISIADYHLHVKQITHPNSTNLPIVFLHDSLGCVDLWRDFPYHLAKATNSNAIVYDRRGYGKSSPFATTERPIHYLENEADILIALLQKLHIASCHLFGHSDGASLSLIASSKYPIYIKKIILEGVHTFVEEITLDGIRKATEQYQTTNLKEKLTKYHGEKTDEVFHAWSTTWLSSQFKTWNIQHFIEKIECPILVFQGEKDEFGSIEQMQSIVARHQGKHRMHLIPGEGHSPHKTSAEVLRLSRDFILNRLG